MDFLAVAVLLISLSSVWGQDPEVTITETQPLPYRGVIQVKRDLDVTLSCYVENKPIDSYVRWNRIYKDPSGRMQIQKISEDVAVEDNIRTSVEKPTQFTWRLRLKNIQVADEGNYNCFVYTTRDNKKEANMTVLVAVPPYLDPERTSSDMTAKSGDTIDLSCNASGRPSPTIQWTRLGNALLPIGKEMHFEPKMTIKQIKPNDRGTYRCRAFNSIGGQTQQVIRDVKIDVRFRPEITPINRVVYQKPGYLIELQCLVEANPFPNADEGGLIWVKGSRVITSSSGNIKIKHTIGAFNRMIFEMILSPVQNNDFGQYRCQVKNAEGTSFDTIELKKSDTPMPSYKLGRVTTGGATTPYFSIATFLSLIIVLVLHRL